MGETEGSGKGTDGRTSRGRVAQGIVQVRQWRWGQRLRAMEAGRGTKAQ